MIEIENLNFAYEKKYIIKDLSINIPEGKLISIVGQNGCGKTTLVKIIARILKPLSGMIKLNGKKISDYSHIEYSRFVSYLPQKIEINQDMSVIDAILTARLLNFLFEPGKNEIKKAKDVIEEFELSKLKDRKLSTLSGGELQKVLIAMVKAKESSVYIFDEPLNNLDIKNQIIIMNIIKSIVKNDRTVLCVIHDINIALNYSDYIIFMKDGNIAGFLKPEEVKNDILKKTFDVDMKIYNFDKNIAVFV